MFAVECLNRIINVCEDKEEHFDYVKAKELRQQNPNSKIISFAADFWKTNLCYILFNITKHQ